MRKQIIIGMASLPEREQCLRDAVISLHDQCDVIHIGLNNYKSIPKWMESFEKVNCYLLDNSLGDAAKFYKIEESNGYYFGCDDDLIYPEYYCKNLIDKCDKYKAVVGYHGVKMSRPITSYYKNRTTIHCLHPNISDTEVDLLGSGACCFDTEVLRVKLSDFKARNMSDIWLADIAKKQGVKAVCIERKNGITYNEKMEDKWTIFDHFRKEKDDIQTKIVQAWKV